MIVLILILSLFLRSFNLSELFYFTHDEATIVWRVLPLLRDGNLFLLGGVTPLHVHLGPWFYYLSAAILFVSNLNPLGWGFAAAILGAITTLITYLFTKKFYDSKTGLIASLLYSTSFLMIAFDRHWWPLVLNPLLSLVVIYSLSQLLNKQFFYAIPLSMALSLGFHTDPSAWGLLLLTLITWVKFKLPLKNKLILLSLSIFAFSFLPLIAFDIKNNGLNLKAISQYQTETKPDQGLSLDRFYQSLVFIPQTLARLIYPGSSELTVSYAYCNRFSQGRLTAVPPLLILISIIIIGFFFLKKTNLKVDWLIKIYFLTIFVGLTIYGNFFSSDLFDHYLSSIFPLFFVMLALLITNLWKKSKPLSVAILALFLILNLNSISQISNSQSQTDKLQAVDWTIENLNGQPFTLDSLGSCFKYNGTRYLYQLKNNPPQNSFVDQNFSWLYSEPQDQLLPIKKVTFTTPDQLAPEEISKYLDLIKSSQASKRFGALQVFITNL